MKARIAFSILSLMLISASAHAAVGVALGANAWAPDGFPDLGPKEQVKAFVCHAPSSKMDGPAALACAVAKCMAHFKVPANTKPDKAGIVGGKCKADGWSERPGHALAYVGDPGDNTYLWSKAIGDAKREDAEHFVRERNFPVKEKNKAFDFYDDGKNGKDIVK